MTPEEAARFILSDCHDPVLRAQCDREHAEAFAEAMKDPAFQARWQAHIKAFADHIDQRIADEIYARIIG